MKMKIVLLLILVALPACFAYNATLGWQTHYGTAPIVIANGGSSGIFPDQTGPAYFDAFNSTTRPMAFLCDLQLTKDNVGVCRTGWNLSTSTNLTNILTNTSAMSTYVIQGVPQTAFFSVDFTLAELNQTRAIQPVASRSPGYDGLFQLLTPEMVAEVTDVNIGLYFWLNVEYPTFYQQHPGKNSLASYLTTFLKASLPSYMSATEVGILKLLKPTAARSGTYLILKVLSSDVVEESTNTTYGQIMGNLTDVATYANGVLVPRELIYQKIPVSNESDVGYYSAAPTRFVQDAHKAGLEVFVYGFANDNYPSSYNYSFDPVLEVLSYIGDSFTVDGIVTDFPTTVAEAINCYPNGYVPAPLSSRGTSRSVAKTVIISHNGASGDYPGCTLTAYEAAINDGADYIDCTVQITSDGVPFCREDANLLGNTNVFSNQDLYALHLNKYPGLGEGVFSFDLSWSEVVTLKGMSYNATIFNPWSKYNVRRNPSNDRKEGIMTLDEFLSFAKNNSGIGVYVNLQNAYFLRTEKSLDLVDAVVTSLSKANITSDSNKVLVASEDSSALAAIRSLVPLIELVYVVPKTPPVSITRPVLEEVKKYASTIALAGRFIDPVDTLSPYLLAKTSVVSTAQSLNMTVFYYFLSNEFNGFAADYRSDPILQIYSLLREYQLDGFITDHPATLHNFLYNNYCWQPLLPGAPNTLNMSANTYPIFPIAHLQVDYALAPSPALAVAEPPISYIVPESSPNPNGTSPGPSPNPSAATKLTVSLFSSMALIFVLSFIL